MSVIPIRKVRGIEPLVRKPRGQALVPLLIGLLSACSGCGPKPAVTPELVPLAGKITVDGLPLTKGSVRFSPEPKDSKRVMVIGVIGINNQDGSYEVNTNGMTGAPKGRYKVTVFTGKAGQIKGNAPFAAKYSSEEETPLTVDVTEIPVPGAYDFKLTKN
jgi:hypothetical protein